jgi:hypothetical protein
VLPTTLNVGPSISCGRRSCVAAQGRGMKEANKDFFKPVVITCMYRCYAKPRSLDASARVRRSPGAALSLKAACASTAVPRALGDFACRQQLFTAPQQLLRCART